METNKLMLLGAILPLLNAYRVEHDQVISISADIVSNEVKVQFTTAAALLLLPGDLQVKKFAPEPDHGYVARIEKPIQGVLYFTIVRQDALDELKAIMEVFEE